MRGEYTCETTQIMTYGELPPRARRILCAVNATQSAIGTTSACAENTSGVAANSGWVVNYLRVRGEYPLIRPQGLGISELPPRARRIPPNLSRTDRTFGTTSACAENTRGCAWCGDGWWNYLRVRGEYKCANPNNHGKEGTTSACAENTRG